mgnify:CR=1 FL=1
MPTRELETEEMATREQLIDRLNDVLAWELAGAIQYMHYAVLVSGVERFTFQDFFHEGSEEARDHAEAVGNKIAALGGIPTMEPAAVQPAVSLAKMLENTLHLEEQALEAWEHALTIGDAVNVGTKLWIEEHVAEEQEHVDELRKMTDAVAYASSPVRGKSDTA